MCLIDEVLDWSATEIRCATGSHRLTSNPLRTEDRLRSECGIEYAAQVIAIHGVLNSTPRDAQPVAGMLVGVRRVTLHVRRLDDIEGDLVVRGVQISGDATAQLYDFSIAAANRTLLAGQATIVLRLPAAAPAPAGARG